MKDCKSGEEVNPETGRCRKKCKLIERRNPKTNRCVKKRRSSSGPEKCKRGEEVNIETGKCRKKCSLTQVRNPETGKCVSKNYKTVAWNDGCKKGEEMDLDTGKCRKRCKMNQVRSPTTGRCISEAKQNLGISTRHIKLITIKEYRERYTKLNELGSGSFGTVYSVLSEDTDELVTVKVFKADNREFADELRILDKLQASCDLLLCVYEAAAINATTKLLVMENIDGVPLDSEEWTSDEAYEIGNILVKGLDKLHSFGIAHKDIKPENIFATQDDRIKFIDYGLSCDAPLCEYGGTQWFMHKYLWKNREKHIPLNLMMEGDWYALEKTIKDIGGDADFHEMYRTLDSLL